MARGRAWATAAVLMRGSANQIRKDEEMILLALAVDESASEGRAAGCGTAAGEAHAGERNAAGLI